jgi:hypothetical protein
VSLDRSVATCGRFAATFEFFCGGRVIRLCAATRAAPNRTTVPYLKTEGRTLAQQGDGFVGFIIGATVTKTFRTT